MMVAHRSKWTVAYGEAMAVTYRLPGRVVDRVDAAAKAMGITKTDVVIQAILAYTSPTTP
jgi:hypothetical protein